MCLHKLIFYVEVKYMIYFFTLYSHPQSMNTSRIDFRIVPVSVNISTPAYYTLAILTYSLGIMHVIMAFWMVVAEYLFRTRPYIVKELKAYL